MEVPFAAVEKEGTRDCGALMARCSPVQQKLQHGLRAGEGSVRGQEDGGVGEVVVAERRQQRLHQALQRSGADAADFARL